MFLRSLAIAAGLAMGLATLSSAMADEYPVEDGPAKVILAGGYGYGYGTATATATIRATIPTRATATIRGTAMRIRTIARRAITATAIRSIASPSATVIRGTIVTTTTGATRRRMRVRKQGPGSLTGAGLAGPC